VHELDPLAADEAVLGIDFKIGECVDTRELRLAIAFLARFPSAYALT